MKPKKFIALGIVITAAFSVIACSKESSTATSNVPTKAQESGETFSANAELQAKVCAALKQIAPNLNKSASAFARAQFAGNLSGAFENSADVLPQVYAEMDAIALKRCAAERQAILAVTETTTLFDATR
jgi:hypothetical protein